MQENLYSLIPGRRKRATEGDIVRVPVHNRIEGGVKAWRDPEGLVGEDELGMNFEAPVQVSHHGKGSDGEGISFQTAMKVLSVPFKDIGER